MFGETRSITSEHAEIYAHVPESIPRLGRRMEHDGRPIHVHGIFITRDRVDAFHSCQFGPNNNELTFVILHEYVVQNQVLSEGNVMTTLI